MKDDQIGMELMRLYRQLRAEVDPQRKALIRRQIDKMLDGAGDFLPDRFVAAVQASRHDG